MDPLPQDNAMTCVQNPWMMRSVTNCPQWDGLSANSGNRNADFAQNAGCAKIALLYDFVYY